MATIKDTQSLKNMIGLQCTLRQIQYSVCARPWRGAGYTKLPAKPGAYHWVSGSKSHTSMFNVNFVCTSIYTVRRIPHIICLSNTTFENVSYRAHSNIS